MTHTRESRILVAVRPRMQAAGLQCLKLRIAVAFPDPQNHAFSGTQVSRKTRSPRWLFMYRFPYHCNNLRFDNSHSERRPKKGWNVGKKAEDPLALFSSANSSVNAAGFGLILLVPASVTELSDLSDCLRSFLGKPGHPITVRVRVLPPF